MSFITIAKIEGDFAFRYTAHVDEKHEVDHKLYKIALSPSSDLTNIQLG